MIGSGDLWAADRVGNYQSADSPTYHSINDSFAISYDSSVSDSGNWSTEMITLPGGVVAMNVLFGAVTSPDSGAGFMGVKLSFPEFMLMKFESGWSSYTTTPSSPANARRPGV